MKRGCGYFDRGACSRNPASRALPDASRPRALGACGEIESRTTEIRGAAAPSDGPGVRPHDKTAHARRLIRSDVRLRSRHATSRGAVERERVAVPYTVAG